MIRKQDEEWMNELSRLYRDNPPESKDIDIEAYERKIREQDEKFGKFDDIIPPHNKYDRIPLQHTIDRMEASYEEVAERYKHNKGKKYKDYNPEDY